MSTEAQPTETTATALWDSHHVRYLTIAFGWSWAIWIGAWLIGRALEVEALFNEDVVWRIIFERNTSTEVIAVSLISMTAVFGPMIGGVIASKRDPAVSSGDLEASVKRVGVGASEYLIMLSVLAAVTLPPLLISILAVERSSDAPTVGRLIPFLFVFFVYQMVTSGTEEIGWRGYLVPKMLVGRNFWDAGWTIGFVWAAWHLPVVVMIFAQQGMVPVQIMGSLAGFTMGIVAMSILHTWFYDRTRSVFLNIVIHALFNTVPLTIVLLFDGSPAALISNLLLWGVVVYLRKKEHISG